MPQPLIAPPGEPLAAPIRVEGRRFVFLFPPQRIAPPPIYSTHLLAGESPSAAQVVPLRVGAAAPLLPLLHFGLPEDVPGSLLSPPLPQIHPTDAPCGAPPRQILRRYVCAPCLRLPCSRHIALR